MDNETKIDCPTYQKQEPFLKEIKEKINKVSKIEEKAKFARELLKELDPLFSCCEQCRFVANLHTKTVALILDVNELKDRPN